MPETLEESFEEATPPKPIQAMPGEEVDLAYLGAVLGDPDGGLFAQGRTLPVAALTHPEARRIWQALQEGTKVDDVAGLMDSTKIPFSRIAELCQMDRMGTMATMHLDELWRRHRRRLKEGLARRIADSPDIQPEEWKREIDAIAEGRDSTQSKPLTQFQIPAANDRSVLLGNRFLNRGDAGVLVSTSGVGKSSMSLQMAVLWALKLDAFGIKGNGALTSLIVQSEDSEGDVGEVWESIRQALNLSTEQIAIVERRVIIVTDRVHRGVAFIAHLRQLIRKHKPDIVWINPLQAFIDGDVTEAKDLGAFLREGLNSLNEPPEFGIIVVHHTTKPPTPTANAQDRKWSEVMYDMSGGAEIINWARFIMSLRATDKEGHFNLVLAKRGRRAGVTKQVEQGVGFREEPVTTIPLKHADRMIALPNGKKMPMIFWEGSDHDPKPAKPINGKPYAPTLEEILPAFRVSQDKALSLLSAERAVSSIRKMTAAQLGTLIAEGVATGRIVRIGDDKAPRYFTGS